MSRVIFEERLSRCSKRRSCRVHGHPETAARRIVITTDCSCGSRTVDKTAGLIRAPGTGNYLDHARFEPSVKELDNVLHQLPGLPVGPEDQVRASRNLIEVVPVCSLAPHDRDASVRNPPATELAAAGAFQAELTRRPA